MIENLIYTSKKVQAAHKLVSELFVDKKDRGRQPYLGHLERVALDAAKKYRNFVYSNPSIEPNKEDFEDVYCAALLHDTPEDSDCTIEDISSLFNMFIVDMVSILTNTKDYSYEEYIKNISNSCQCICIKLADLEDNMDIKRLPKSLTEKDLQRLKKYHDSWLYLIKKLKEF